MQWSDVIAAPKPKMLRQFAGLWLLFFVALAGWRVWRGQTGVVTDLMAIGGVVVGAVGLWRPTAIRFIYSGWMVAAFPIGWTVSRLMLATMFYVVFTPVALVFRLMGRDALGLRHDQVPSFWRSKPGPATTDEYLRQS